MKKMNLFQLISCTILLCISHAAWSQDGLVSHYSFDGCSVTDQISGNTAVGVGTLSCDCALSQDGLVLNGVDQGLDSLTVPAGFLNRDFSIRFYFNPSNIAGIYDILSKGNTCFDSVFVARYDAVFNQITVEITESLGRAVLLTGEVVDGLCWHEVVIMRQGDTYRLFIDGELGTRRIFEGGISVTNDAPFRISNGPCVQNGTVSRLDGVIDELSFFNRPLNINEFGQLLTPDQLLTQDTIIFEGDTVFARSLINCAETISWMPVSSIDDPSLANPALFPSMTTTYSVSYKSDQCFSTDTLRVIVTRPEDLDCAKLDLPTAFTPNADGLNDFFGISNPFLINALESFDIYDRQGAIVFSGLNPTDLWDGNVNGTRLIPGVYVYKIRYTCQGGDELKIGSFTLMR